MCITGEIGGFRDHFGAEKNKEKKTDSNVMTSDQQNKKSTNVSTTRLNREFCLRIIKSKRDLIVRH